MLRPLQPIQSLEERVTVVEEKFLEVEADMKQLIGRLEAQPALVAEAVPLDLQGGGGKGDSTTGQALAELPMLWATSTFASETHPAMSELKKPNPTPEIRHLDARKRPSGRYAAKI
ncbi:hypothetical protein GUJ93_ZPchr0005g14441 [Zizania palustris]|uniref:Uncharacterized protein n=1 Tax=Zizania palustris TaxID=103762 RepID=A0A8J5VRW6_ZIZPA|nr:hypothetical protein GUJ93_ZPchr0005g14441 [Zizania palustris]